MLREDVTLPSPNSSPRVCINSAQVASLQLGFTALRKKQGALSISYQAESWLMALLATEKQMTILSPVPKIIC